MKTSTRTHIILGLGFVAATLVTLDAAQGGRSTTQGTRPTQERGATNNTLKAPVRFTALAVRSTVGQAGTIDIRVERWSTDAERDKLYTALVERGPEKLLDTLQSLPRIGSFGSAASIGYDLRYARAVQSPDGTQRVTLATDRQMPFWERAEQPITMNYPFTVIELRLKPSGDGEGKISLAAQIGYDKDTKTLTIEDWETQPVMLTTVKRLD